MDIVNFMASLASPAPPEDVSVYLLSLWYDAKGDWNMAHETIQDVETKNAAWIHAYLHRKEGDRFNADYWYNRAGRQRPSLSLKEEWESIAGALIDEQV